MQTQPLPAGTFSTWLKTTRDALLHDCGSAVPCGECTACCHSSYFIHIEPDETETLARIPKELHFPAPGLPKGHVVLGYDEQGRCPMFDGNGCSIYEYRPLTCRTYDCRIFAAAGLLENDTSKSKIDAQIKRWVFSYPTQLDRNEQQAVLDGTRFLQKFGKHFPALVVPSKLAVFAIKVYQVFMDKRNESIADLEKVKLVMEAFHQFST